MSIRPNTVTTGSGVVDAHPLRMEIEAMRTAHAMAENGQADLIGSGELTLDQLNEVERSAATIGAQPDAWKPIGFMNNAHYGTLLKKNALDGRLTQQIESYKVVSNM